MSDVVTDTTALNGWFRVKYGKFMDVIPASEKLTAKLGKVTKAQQIGKQFQFPIELALPQGVTYKRSGQGAFTINDAVAGVMDEVVVDASQIIINDVLDYESAAKAQSAGDEAFGDAAGRVMKRLQKSGHKRIELGMWYGQTNLGIITAISGTSTTRTLTISTATWAPGIWIGMGRGGASAGGMPIDIYASFTYPATFGTLLTNSATTCYVTSVNVSNRTIAIVGDSGDMTDVDSNVGTAVITPTAAVESSGTAFNEMVGLDKMCKTSTGDLMSVSTTAEMWQANVFSVGSTALTLKKIYDGTTDGAAKYGEGKLSMFVSLKTWANLASDQASMRKYDAKYSEEKAENGFRSLEFMGQTGSIEIIPYSIIKEGEAFCFPIDMLLKIGAQDLSFNIPGRGEAYFENVPNKAGYRLQMYSNLAIVPMTLGGFTKFEGIVNS